MQEDCGAAESRASYDFKSKLATFTFWAVTAALAACAIWRIADSVVSP